MNQPPDDRTQPLPSDPTAEQAPVPAADQAAPAAPTPDWAHATTAGAPPASVAPAAPVVPVATTSSWRSRIGGGKGLAVVALVVGLGLGAVGGSVATWAAVHDSHGVGTTADGRGFDRDGDGDFGPRGGFPPDGGQRPGGDRLGGGQQPGGSSGSGTDANGTSQAT